jgi:F1-F0 ATPase (N-ATPase) AtpR subunit
VSATWILSLAAVPFGLVLGVANYGLLRHNADLFARGGSLSRAVTLQLLRLGVVAAALGLAVRGGALPLLATALGFLVARRVVARRLGLPA